MLSIRINSEKISKLFWEQVFSAAYFRHTAIIEALCQQAIEQELLREKAALNTGSINISTAWALYSATYSVKPKVVVEVGTFIGRSTQAMALAMDYSNSSEPIIYTCDYSNSIDIKAVGKVKIRQFKKTRSTEMFNSLADQRVMPDLVFLDGRISDADMSILSSLSKPETVYLLDDVEGIEKGVYNAQKMSTFLLQSHLFIYPPETKLLQRYGVFDRCVTGAWVPLTALSISRQ